MPGLGRIYLIDLSLLEGIIFVNAPTAGTISLGVIFLAP
jgi:hypothetical protein